MQEAITLLAFYVRKVDGSVPIKSPSDGITVDELLAALEIAKEKLEKQDAVLSAIFAGPSIHGIVIDILGVDEDGIPRLVVSTSNGVNVVPCDPNLFPSIGQPVRMHPRSGSVIGLVKYKKDVYPYGRILKVASFDERTNTLIVDSNGEPRRVRTFKKAEPGDRVLCDEIPSVVITNLGKDEQKFVVKVDTVNWSDIGGLVEAKKQMIEAVELPVKHAKLYKKYNKKPVKGVLLEGPPGCGKTMLGKAAATALANLHGISAKDTGFMYVKGPEVLSKWVGETESTIRGLFARARDHKKKYNYPAIIFIDEAEALLGSRTNDAGTSRNWMSGTVVPTFLAEMDGLEESGAMILLSTNHASQLDTAIVREGRIDRKVEVTRPNQNDSAEIFIKHLRHIPLSCKKTVNEMAEMCSKELFDSKFLMYNLTTESGVRVPFTFGNLVSGAMIAGVVDQATSLALHRNIESGGDAGIIEEDLLNSVNRIFQQNKSLDHSSDLKSFARSFKEQVVEVSKV